MTESQIPFVARPLPTVPVLCPRYTGVLSNAPIALGPEAVVHVRPSAGRAPEHRSRVAELASFCPFPSSYCTEQKCKILL